MFDKRKFFIIIGYFINLCSSQVNQCSKWNMSSKIIIYGNDSGLGDNDSLALNLLNSALDINRNTGELAVLDDNNHRILIFNQSNTSTLFAILSDSSNLTNNSNILYSPSAVLYAPNNSIYILDDWNKQIIQMTYPLQYGDNSTINNTLIYSYTGPVYNSTVVGLCVDITSGTIFISDKVYNHIARMDINPLGNNYGIYVANVSNGSISYPLKNPTSIVMNNDRTLFVNDVGNNQIQMFQFNSTNGITLPLPTYINGCISLSLYSTDILVINTKNSVYLFNLTNNDTICAIGCSNSTQLNDIHNALIDNNENLIITDSNQIVSYPIYQQCPVPNPYDGFVPTDNCRDPDMFGINCLSSRNICLQSTPCLNLGNCSTNTTNKSGYTCQCVSGFQGNNCEDDQRPCRPAFCFGRGACVFNTSTDFTCNCLSGYEGDNCEKTVDFCANTTCQNRGVCSRQFRNFTCNCLSGYSGRLCEITETSNVVHAYVSRSFSYIAIIMMALLVGFIVFMDILKYIFGIDPVQTDRDAIRKKQMKKNKKNKVKLVYRFQYVN